jgi:uncharacterized protein (TIGR02598 family)
VEIKVALVVISVGLIAIVGLIPQGIQSSRSASDNTLVATIVHDIFNTIRSQRQQFTAVNLNGFGFGAATYNLQTAIPASGTAYFDSSGFNTATPADYYYRVVLNFQLQGTLPLSLVTATVVWPAKQTTVWPLNTNIFFTEIARYQ